jgi:hypothetical protein
VVEVAVAEVVAAVSVEEVAQEEEEADLEVAVAEDDSPTDLKALQSMSFVYLDAFFHNRGRTWCFQPHSW